MNRPFFSLFIVLAAFAECNSTVLHVPQDFVSIQQAISSASPFDTVLLSNGQYRVNLSVTSSITIASNWIISNDSTDRDQTVLLPSSLRILSVYAPEINLTGLTFSTSGNPSVGRGIISSGNTRIIMRFCLVEGVFDTVIPRNGLGLL